MRIRTALPQDVANLGPHDVGQVGVATGRGELSRPSLCPYLQGAYAFLINNLC
jgi:hypothetical protein